MVPKLCHVASYTFWDVGAAREELCTAPTGTTTMSPPPSARRRSPRHHYHAVAAIRRGRRHGDATDAAAMSRTVSGVVTPPTGRSPLASHPCSTHQRGRHHQSLRVRAQVVGILGRAEGIWRTYRFILTHCSSPGRGK
jgi:hypothetical protein